MVFHALICLAGGIILAVAAVPKLFGKKSYRYWSRDDRLWYSMLLVSAVLLLLLGGGLLYRSMK